VQGPFLLYFRHMQIPSGAKWILFAGAVVVLGGFVLGDRAYRNPVVHGIVDLVDLKDGPCQESVVAAGTSCPSGCRAKPLAGPELSDRVPECRSILWVATCGKECDPRSGLIRTDDGRFLTSDTLIIKLDDPPEGYKDELAGMGLRLESSISGLWRYRASFDNPEDDIRVLERMESRIEALPYAVSVDRIVR